ncbi:hypothetical protein HK102_002045 [Quaeritorhiza haematococci]|nr:hypothetical protein HK102_002045 [Quaeritorhiza haematococci]
MFLSLATLLLASAHFVAAQQLTNYTVKVTNLTNRQPFSPLLVVAHDPSIELFIPGTPSSPQLRTLAEEGNAQPLADSLKGNPNVFGMVIASGPTAPLGSQEMTLCANVPAGKVAVVSALAMLVNTNDCFLGQQPVVLPQQRGQKWMRLVSGWDAGTEENNEMCEYIPGPGCPNSINMSTNGTGEGVIHMHRGFHGLSANRTDGVRGLRADVYDWRDRVAQLVISMQ